MLRTNFWCGAVFASFTALTASAQCELQVSRVACPGKEEISFGKCRGQASCATCVEKVNREQCVELAKRACSNPRPNITKSKQINASFDGVALHDGASDDFCQACDKRSLEFDQC